MSLVTWATTNSEGLTTTLVWSLLASTTTPGPLLPRWTPALHRYRGDELLFVVRIARAFDNPFDSDLFGYVLQFVSPSGNNQFVACVAGSVETIGEEP